MNTNIEKLYRKVLDQSTDISLSLVLPLALRLAKEVGNKDFERWIRLELDEYYNDNPAMEDNTRVPEYRITAGQHHDEYGRPLIITDPNLLFVNQYPLRNGVTQLELWSKKSNLLSIHDPQFQKLIEEHLHVNVHVYNFSSTEISGILGAIRSKLIDWLYKIQEPESLMDDSKTPSLSLTSRVSLSLHGLHPRAIEVAANLYNDEYYRQAILDTYIALVQAVKIKSGRYDLDGSGLMQTVFSPKKPLLIISDDTDEQMGYMWMFSGAVMGIRNPKAHTLTLEEDRQVALEWLAFASVLLKLLDKAKVPSYNPTTYPDTQHT